MAGKNDVADEIRRMIHAGEAKPGQAIGSIEAAASTFEASVGATRLAFQELVAQGYLVARGRAGHFVAETVPDVDTVEFTRRRLPVDRLEALEAQQEEILKRLAALERRRK